MRRGLVLLLVLVVAACGGSADGFYDDQARDEARRAAMKDPFDGYSERVSVGSVRERESCPQAPSPHSGPCLAVTVDVELPARHLSGEKAGFTIPAAFDAFVWLKRGGNGHWKVVHITHRPKGAESASAGSR